MHARIERHGSLLAEMSRAIQTLDSELEARVVRAVRSELGAQVAGMEERLARKALMGVGCGRGESSGAPKPERRSAESASAGRFSSNSRDTSGDLDVSADRGHTSAPPMMHASDAPARPTSTGALKHSFLRRFARTESRSTARKSSPGGETYKGKAPGLAARLLETVFGICEPDPKLGKEGSKVIHPQSHFYTGLSVVLLLIDCLLLLQYEC